MAVILNIESSLDSCSVALSRNGDVFASLQSSEARSHATILTVLIQQLMSQNALTYKELDAFAVSKGPGSYTGLRIGVSVAKGLCYGSGKPLIGINTLESMMNGLKFEFPDFKTHFPDDTIFCPMIDARRSEVYMAQFSKNSQWLQETTAQIIHEESFADILKDHKMVFFGNGSDKVKNLIQHENAVFIENFLQKADNLASLAEHNFQKQLFEDVAYFEPLYLKDFVATTPKRKVI